MAKFGQSWGDTANLRAGLALIGFGEVSSGALAATVGAAGLMGFVLGRREKFGPEFDRTRRRIQESVRAGFATMLKVEGDDWSAHAELEAADAALCAALKACMIDRQHLAAAAVSREGFPAGVVATVMDGLAKANPAHFAMREPEEGKPEKPPIPVSPLAHRYAEQVVSAGIRAAAENEGWYRALEPDLILAIGQALGETRERVVIIDERTARMEAMLARIEAQFGGAEKVDETAERLHVSRPELLALLGAIFEQETPVEKIDEALLQGKARLASMRAELAALRNAANEIPELQADIARAQAALAQKDIVALGEAEAALESARIRWDETLREEAARRDATTFNLYTASGDLAAARLDHEAAARHFAEGAARLSTESRLRMLMLEHEANALAVSGGERAGLAALNALLDVARARKAAAPDDWERLRDVSVSLNRVGDVRLAEGDRAGALAAYQAALAIARDLAGRDPGNAEWARDVVVSLAKMAQANEARAVEYWAEAAERVEDMSRRGVLAPVDEWMIEETKTQLSKARAR